MQKYFILMISFLILSDIFSEISNVRVIEYKRGQAFKLRSFAIHSLKALRDIRRSYELQQQIKKEAERQLAKEQEELRRNKEKMQREKIQLNFGPSSFFKDFHTSRFF